MPDRPTANHTHDKMWATHMMQLNKLIMLKLRRYPSVKCRCAKSSKIRTTRNIRIMPTIRSKRPSFVNRSILRLRLPASFAISPMVRLAQSHSTTVASGASHVLAYLARTLRGSISSSPPL